MMLNYITQIWLKKSVKLDDDLNDGCTLMEKSQAVEELKRVLREGNM